MYETHMNSSPTEIGKIEFNPENIQQYLDYQHGKTVRRMFHGTCMTAYVIFLCVVYLYVRVENIVKTGFLMRFESHGAHYFASHSMISHCYCMKTPFDFGMIVADVACKNTHPQPIIAVKNDHAIIPRYVIKFITYNKAM
jgi:hypothetical protein